jgi:NAD(P)-dependent dehydrogenase (short-subunit alcohol dehydrogenase family)
MEHPAISPGRVAVVTGAASGIGLAVAKRLAHKGMSVCLADRDEQTLRAAVQNIDGDVFGHVTDVADFASVQALRDAVVERYGEVGFLLNNAGIGGRGATSWSGLDVWQRILSVNLWGVVHGLHAFAELMIRQGTPCAIVNTGSKQGITNPPGNPAYNVSKAGVKFLTECLAHELRSIDGCRVSAHLLVPGFTYTGMIAAFVPEKPPAAWTPDQVAERLLERIGRGDFYVVCPDNDVTEAMDHARMQWNLDDMIRNRPALSRWHPDFGARFEQHMRDALETAPRA